MHVVLPSICKMILMTSSCLFVTVFLVNSLDAQSNNDSVYMVLNSMGQCLGKNLPVRASDTLVKVVAKNKYLISSNMKVLQDIDGPLQMKMVVQKCTEKNKPNSCTFYFQVTGDGCKQLKDKRGLLYDMFKKANRVPHSCPIKKGIYKMENYDLEATQAQAKIAKQLSPIWRVTITAKSNNDEILCTDAEIGIHVDE